MYPSEVRNHLPHLPPRSFTTSPPDVSWNDNYNYSDWPSDSHTFNKASKGNKDGVVDSFWKGSNAHSDSNVRFYHWDRNKNLSVTSSPNFDNKESNLKQQNNHKSSLDHINSKMFYTLSPITPRTSISLNDPSFRNDKVPSETTTESKDTSFLSDKEQKSKIYNSFPAVYSNSSNRNGHISTQNVGLSPEYTHNKYANNHVLETTDKENHYMIRKHTTATPEYIYDSEINQYTLTKYNTGPPRQASNIDDNHMKIHDETSQGHTQKSDENGQRWLKSTTFPIIYKTDVEKEEKQTLKRYSKVPLSHDIQQTTLKYARVPPDHTSTTGSIHYTTSKYTRVPPDYTSRSSGIHQGTSDHIKVLLKQTSKSGNIHHVTSEYTIAPPYHITTSDDINQPTLQYTITPPHQTATSDDIHQSTLQYTMAPPHQTTTSDDIHQAASQYTVVPPIINDETKNKTMTRFVKVHLKQTSHGGEEDQLLSHNINITTKLTTVAGDSEKMTTEHVKLYSQFKVSESDHISTKYSADPTQHITVTDGYDKVYTTNFKDYLEHTKTNGGNDNHLKQYTIIPAKYSTRTVGNDQSEGDKIKMVTVEHTEGTVKGYQTWKNYTRFPLNHSNNHDGKGHLPKVPMEYTTVINRNLSTSMKNTSIPMQHTRNTVASNQMVTKHWSTEQQIEVTSRTNDETSNAYIFNVASLPPGFNDPVREASPTQSPGHTADTVFITAPSLKDVEQITYAFSKEYFDSSNGTYDIKTSLRVDTQETGVGNNNSTIHPKGKNNSNTTQLSSFVGTSSSILTTSDNEITTILAQIEYPAITTTEKPLNILEHTLYDPSSEAASNDLRTALSPATTNFEFVLKGDSTSTDLAVINSKISSDKQKLNAVFSAVSFTNTQAKEIREDRITTFDDIRTTSEFPTTVSPSVVLSGTSKTHSNAITNILGVHTSSFSSTLEPIDLEVITEPVNPEAVTESTNNDAVTEPTTSEPCVTLSNHRESILNEGVVVGIVLGVLALALFAVAVITITYRKVYCYHTTRQEAKSTREESEYSICSSRTSSHIELPEATSEEMVSVNSEFILGNLDSSIFKEYSSNYSKNTKV
ncbi:uncharacterized protein LOC143246571 [Tachypleus tridentatus]|uniref:uncharacterized protein LOC143246571 n=1 Tax=Tachypleus tridentatus TaxID=6853 RepID=UPI003FD4270C